MGGRPKDTKENLQALLDSKGISITILGEYINQKTSIECECKLCGYLWRTTPTTLKGWKGGACTYCTKGTTRTTEEFQRVLDDLDKGFTVLGRSTKKYHFEVRCQRCERVWESTSSNLKINDCARCSGKEKKSTQQVQAALKEKFIEVSGVYENAFTKLQCRCSKCQEQWESSYHNLSYHGCPFCCFKGRIPKNRSASLYYVRIEKDSGVYWKIGITTKSDVLSRFKKDRNGTNVVLLYSFLFDDGAQAYYAEKNILRLYKQYLNKDLKLLSDGNTEIFMVDVLQMDHLGGGA